MKFIKRLFSFLLAVMLSLSLLSDAYATRVEDEEIV